MIAYHVVTERPMQVGQQILFDEIYDRIENCASLEYVISELEKNKELLSISDMMKIIRYWNSFKTQTQ